jgi:hypothetical protein
MFLKKLEISTFRVKWLMADPFLRFPVMNHRAMANFYVLINGSKIMCRPMGTSIQKQENVLSS